MNGASLLLGVSGGDLTLGSESLMESLGCCLTLSPDLVTVRGVCGVVKAGEVGRSGTAGTGWRRGRDPTTPHLAPGTWHGTAATGSGSTFWTGATREEERGVSWNDPL